MKVRWKEYHNGFNGPHYPGEVSDVPAENAKFLIHYNTAEAAPDETDASREAPQANPDPAANSGRG